ncbi:MAG: phosphotransferase [Acidimicrobiales bacterium]|jgi:thiamine kinase-like enzyme
MSSTIAEVVSRLWPGVPAVTEPLAGGITNTNYRVEAGGERFVVRLIGAHTELLGIDRGSELEACRLAAALGIGPELVSADLAEGVVVTRFIEGRPIAPEEVGAEPVVAELAAALARVHAAGTVASAFDTFRLVPAYRALAGGHGVAPTFDYDTMAGTLERLAAVRPWQPEALCHNDLLNSNLLHDGGVRIVDWEYAGMGDRFFDLGNLAVNHRFGEAQEEALLRHYFGTAEAPQLAALRLFELASEAREAMWGVVQMAISTLEVDFEAYAAEHAAGFFETLESVDLEASLELAALVP